MKNRVFVLVVLCCGAFFSCASAKKKDAKNYVGWIEPDNSKIDVSLGCVRMSFRPKIGSFNIFVIDENNKEQSVFSTQNEFSASSFYLKCGKENDRFLDREFKVFKLDLLRCFNIKFR